MVLFLLEILKIAGGIEEADRIVRWNGNNYEAIRTKLRFLNIDIRSNSLNTTIVI